MAVVVVDSLSGMTEQVFALAVHRAWGVGKAGSDNGIVLLWAPSERATYVSVGRGLEGVLPDRRTGRILDEHLMPAFREQRFDDGMVATVTALAAAVREETVQGVQSVQGVRDDEDSGPLIPVLGSLAAIGAGAGGAVGYRRWKRRRPRKCPKCGTMMDLLDEQQDDSHLEEGAKAEERLRSIDWDVWVCPNDGEAEIIPCRKLFGGFEKCPQCQRLTAKAGSSRTITAATTMSTGLARVSHACRHCHHAWETTTTIPRISASSGSSGSSGGSRSGGSSFGGGSAGGGGAGRRY